MKKLLQCYNNFNMNMKFELKIKQNMKKTKLKWLNLVSIFLCDIYYVQNVYVHILFYYIFFLVNYLFTPEFYAILARQYTFCSGSFHPIDTILFLKISFMKIFRLRFRFRWSGFLLSSFFAFNTLLLS